MPIVFGCPQCGVTHQVDDSLSGMQARCPCGAVLNLPVVSSTDDLLDDVIGGGDEYSLAEESPKAPHLDPQLSDYTALNDHLKTGWRSTSPQPAHDHGIVFTFWVGGVLLLGSGAWFLISYLAGEPNPIPFFILIITCMLASRIIVSRF